MVDLCMSYVVMFAATAAKFAATLQVLKVNTVWFSADTHTNVRWIVLVLNWDGQFEKIDIAFNTIQ